MGPVQPSDDNGAGPTDGACTCHVAASRSSLPAHSPVTVRVSGSPSTAMSTEILGASGACRFAHPSCQTFALRFAQRLHSPVRASSTASAKLDLPLPLRPTTRVSPGPGCSGSAVSAPMPRKPRTVTVPR